MTKSLEKLDFARMRTLFVLSFKWATARIDNGDVRREVTKHFRCLSKRFHPDKHRDLPSSQRYKVAFQALNEAHADVQSLIMLIFD